MLTAINTILYASDLNPQSDSCLSMVMSLAEKYQATVTVLTVVEPIDPSLYVWGQVGSWSEVEKNTFQRAQSTSEQQVSDFMDNALLKDASVLRPDIKVVNGPVAKSILGYADDINADLIVMGSNGHSAIGELLLGSVADKVMRLSKRPVLLVPVSAS